METKQSQGLINLMLNAYGVYSFVQNSHLISAEFFRGEN